MRANLSCKGYMYRILRPTERSASFKKTICAFFFTWAGFRTVFIRSKSRASLKYRFPARAILKIKFFSHICSTVLQHCRGAFPHTLLEEPSGIAIKNKGIIGIPLKEQSHQILDFLVGSMELNQYVLQDPLRSFDISISSSCVI